MDDLVRLRWTSHQGVTLSMLDSFLASETLVDVTLACDGQHCQAHKIILSACSPYFQEILGVSTVNKHTIIFLKDVKYSELQALVQYMYRGEVNISKEDLPSFLAVADALKIRGLASTDTHTSANTLIIPSGTNNSNTYNQIHSSSFLQNLQSSSGRSSSRNQNYTTATPSTPPQTQQLIDLANPSVALNRTRSTTIASNSTVGLDFSRTQLQAHSNFDSLVEHPEPMIEDIHTEIKPETQSYSISQEDFDTTQVLHESTQDFESSWEKAEEADFNGSNEITGDIICESSNNRRNSSPDLHTVSSSELKQRRGNTSLHVPHGVMSVIKNKQPIRPAWLGNYNKKPKFRCPNANCGRVYSTKGTLSRHINYECHKEPQFGCKFCGVKMKLKTNVVAHEFRCKTKHRLKQSADIVFPRKTPCD